MSDVLEPDVIQSCLNSNGVNSVAENEMNLAAKLVDKVPDNNLPSKRSYSDV
ncbi:hypothetical protein [Paraglaciecola arctica]|uniref:Uncharacterized protein n=1 Tax=Paraglaciecola arctica BSs20135 TaxID=493475 RepID=K6ZFM9_9ALTE|nr:hypothetical protein [Paraglaciecola arctica]GAC22220.1 hypothetical protein GARC_5285 [Paraglaciecola arctica BSs20135]